MLKINFPLTPCEISNSIQALCAEISPGRAPYYVDVSIAPEAIQNECFGNVDNKVNEVGGSRVLGWTIWEFPGIFVEAECHAIWETLSGELIDITPKARPTERILFLPDESINYRGQSINNIRRSTSSDPRVSNYLAAHDAIYEFANRGERAQQFGEIALNPEDAAEYEYLQERAFFLANEISDLFPLITAYSPCLCGSGKKVKWCHGMAHYKQST